jgi:hypothetical protein
MSNILEVLDKYRISIVILLCVLSLAFICFGHIYREQVQLMLKREFFKFPSCSIDWWSISHFALFAIFGFLIPEYPLTFFVLGTGFEVIEDALSSDATTQFANCTNYDTKRKSPMCWASINDDYWYCNMTDPWVNLTGYILGSAVRTVFFAPPASLAGTSAGVSKPT